MKTIVKLKTITFIAFAVWSTGCFAQVKTMYVMKNGEVVFQSPVPDIDNVTFDEIADGDAMIVHKNDGSPADQTLLSDIQQIYFLSENLSVETLNGSEMYAFENIAKLLFDNVGTTEINNSSVQSDIDVLVSVTSAGDVIVSSSVAIKSFILFSVDGKTVSKQQCDDIETQCTVSLRDCVTGVYLLRVETEQGSVVKKIVKPLNK